MKVALKIENDLIVSMIFLTSKDYSKYTDYEVVELTQEQLENIKTNHTHLAKLLANDFSENKPTKDEVDKLVKRQRIQKLKQLLAETDYRAIKYAEGYYTEEEYAPYKTLRQSYRDEINQLEEEIKQYVEE